MAGASQKKVAWKWVPIATLVPYERNARVHDDAQIAQIAGSIEAFGWQNAILVDRENVIIAGHGRLEGAKLLASQGKGDLVPIVVAKDLDEAQARLLRLADNKIALNSSWDDEILALELVNLGADLDVAALDLTGFNDAEIAQLLSDGTETDPEGEWKGMPEFVQPEQKAFRKLVVHFKDQSAVDAFAVAIGQKITDATRFVAYPEIEIETYADKRYDAVADA